MKRTLFFIFFLSSSIIFAQSPAFTKIEQEINQQIQQGQWDEVLMKATDLLVEEPGRGEGYYYTAMAFFKQDSYDKAREYLRQATPLADAALNQKIASLDQEIQKSSQQKELITSAEKQIQSGDKLAAAKAYQNVWENNKSDVTAALNAVEIYLDNEEYEQALSILSDPSLAKDPGAIALIRRINDTPAMMQINGYNAAMEEAHKHIAAENYGSAILLYDKALVFQPNDSKALESKRIAEDELAWKNTRTQHSIEGYEAYLVGTTLKNHKNEAISFIRDGLIFHGEAAANANNIANMEFYLNKYLNSYGGGKDDGKVKNLLCNTYRSNAEKLVPEKNAYSQQRAIEFYKAAQNYCPQEDLSEKIALAEKKHKKYGRPDRGYLAYVYDSIAPIGLSIGSINNRSIGMYLSGSINTDLFTEEATSTIIGDGFPTETKVGYGDAILGLTKQIAYPVWIYAGGGAAFKNIYEGWDTGNEIEWVKNTEESNISFIGDAGVIINISSLFLRAGVKSDLEEFRFAGGIGFSW